MFQFDDSRYVDAKQYHLASFSTRNSTLNTSLRKPIRMQDFIQLCDSIIKQNCRFRLTCTSITLRKLHLKSRRSSKFLQKPHTEPILCFDCIPIVVFDNPEEDNCSNTIDAYTTQNDFLGFPVPPFIANIF